MVDTLDAHAVSLARALGGCSGCLQDRFVVPFTMAFQPIVRADTNVFAYEALVRGFGGEGAGTIMSKITDTNRYSFDQRCRTTAIETAAALGLADTGAMLSINFKPNAIYEPLRCLATSLAAAAKVGIPNSAIMFEITEDELVRDPRRLRNIVTAYQEIGFTVALDDFGAGYASLGMLIDIQPDVIKLDMKLVRGIDADPVRVAVVRSMVSLCRELGIELIAEGVETVAEYRTLQSIGVVLFQGFLFAHPMIGLLQAPAPVIAE